MPKERLLQRLLTQVVNLINNPCIYVAACIGTFVGALTGGAVGFFAGWFITNPYNLSELVLENFKPAMALGSVLGLLIGGMIGGIFTGTVAIYKIHKRTYKMKVLSHENIASILLSALYISIEIAIGMGIGAVIGSLKLPGIGSIIGAFIGVVLMFFTATLDKSKK